MSGQVSVVATQMYFGSGLLLAMDMEPNKSGGDSHLEAVTVLYQEWELCAFKSNGI